MRATVGGVIMEKVKLVLLRFLLIMIMEVVVVATKVIKKKYHFPVKWLLHFLKGSGTALEVPAHLVEGAKSAMREAVRANLYHAQKASGKYCVYSSTVYEGAGFSNRPELFYLVGGFTFRLYKNGTVSAGDYYDWHSSDGAYFTSPLGEGKLWNLVIRFLGFIFGDDLFVTKGFPCGSQGISNKLWEQLYQVGAKSFHSYFKNVPVFDNLDMQEISILRRSLDGEELSFFTGKKELYSLVKEHGCKYPVAFVQETLRTSGIFPGIIKFQEWDGGRMRFVNEYCLLSMPEGEKITLWQN